MRIELTMPAFQAEHCQLIARADRVSFLGTRGFPGRPGPTPSASRLGAVQSTGGLALVGMCYTNIYLGPKITSRPPGTSPGTPSPPGCRVREMIHLLHALQVSKQLEI